MIQVFPVALALVSPVIARSWAAEVEQAMKRRCRRSPHLRDEIDQKADGFAPG